ncbi:MAG: recombination protein O N-terminal domain-containing protein, partial [Acidobacteriota bacterium]
MPLKKDEAYVLDVRKLPEADRLLVFFTREEGKLKGVARSAARSRRRFGGKLERLSRVRVSYLDREGRDLLRIDS